MNLYDPLLERDEAGIRAAVQEFRRSRGSGALFAAIARFAVLAYAPSQHSKHALICCLAAHELREQFGPRFDEILTECAIYAAAARQPWSEPPLTDPPPLDGHQRGDIEELRECVAAADRLRAERWLAKRYRDDDFRHDLFSVASDDFEDLGHKLIMAVTAWKLAAVFGEEGRYATLRTAIREMVAYRGARYAEGGGALDAASLRRRLADNMVAGGGDVISAHSVFLFDAAVQTADSGVIRRVADYLTSTTHPVAAGSGPPAREAEGAAPAAYRFARDYGELLQSFAVARRWGDDRIVAAAEYNLDHAPSFEEFPFA